MITNMQQNLEQRNNISRWLWFMNWTVSRPPYFLKLDWLKLPKNLQETHPISQYPNQNRLSMTWKFTKILIEYAFPPLDAHFFEARFTIIVETYHWLFFFF